MAKYANYHWEGKSATFVDEDGAKVPDSLFDEIRAEKELEGRDEKNGRLRQVHELFSEMSDKAECHAALLWLATVFGIKPWQ